MCVTVSCVMCRVCEVVCVVLREVGLHRLRVSLLLLRPQLGPQRCPSGVPCVSRSFSFRPFLPLVYRWCPAPFLPFLLPVSRWSPDPLFPVRPVRSPFRSFVFLPFLSIISFSCHSFLSFVLCPSFPFPSFRSALPLLFFLSYVYCSTLLSFLMFVFFRSSSCLLFCI